MGKKVTVKEFAKMAEVSEQSVYKRLTTSLKPYLTMVDNRKMIDISALSEIYHKDIMQPLNNLDSTRFNNLETASESQLQIEILQKQIEDLKQDKEQLREELSVKNEQIRSLSETVGNITRQLENSQAQLLREQELLYLQMGGEPPVEEPPADEAEIIDEEAEEPPQEEPKEKDQPKKRGLFKWLRR